MRPSRALRSDLTSFPNPGSTNSPFDLTSRAASVDSSSKNSLTCALFIPVDSAKWLITSDCVMRFLPVARSEEHTSELQSQSNLVCRLLLEKKKKKRTGFMYILL